VTRHVEEFEISALLDGELDPKRAAEVRSAIERDPVLQSQFKRLGEADRAWAGAARSAQFMPAVPWDAVSPSPSRAHAWVVTALAFMMVAGRLIPKILQVDPAAGVLVHLVMLAAVIAFVAWISGHIVPKMNGPAAAS